MVASRSRSQLTVQSFGDVSRFLRSGVADEESRQLRDSIGALAQQIDDAIGTRRAAPAAPAVPDTFRRRALRGQRAGTLHLRHQGFIGRSLGPAQLRRRLLEQFPKSVHKRPGCAGRTPRWLQPKVAALRGWSAGPRRYRIPQPGLLQAFLRTPDKGLRFPKRVRRSPALPRARRGRVIRPQLSRGPQPIHPGQGLPQPPRIAGGVMPRQSDLNHFNIGHGLAPDDDVPAHQVNVMPLVRARPT